MSIKKIIVNLKQDTPIQVRQTKQTPIQINQNAGRDGRSAYKIALDNGFVGTTNEWVDSLKGDSAYDIALNNGFVGTEDQWLDSLKTGISVTTEDAGYILSNDGSVLLWESFQDKLNTEEIEWDLGEM